ncbi:MAG: DUF4350 domain-containing protein [Putridiphycobacter sp.]
MSQKTKNILIIGGSILLGGILIYFFGLKSESQYVSENWEETYSPDDKGPYGTYVLKELLDTVGFFGEFIEIDNKLTEGLKDDKNQNDIYFFVGKENHMSDESCEKLLEFVGEGNTAFIAARVLPYELRKELFLNPSKIFLTEKDSLQKLKFEHPELHQKKFNIEYIYKNKINAKPWKFFKPNNFEVFEDNSYTILGKNLNGDINFIKYNYFGGEIFLHSNPYIFTNISMFKQSGYEYTENLLKHIPPGRMQWDKYNLEHHYSFNTNNNNNQNGNGDIDRRSPLEFIFKNIALTWAFVIIIIAALLYMLFKSKRMQNIVKPAELKENTSLRYVETLSSLYLQEKKHAKLIALKEKTFMNFIAEHYYLSTNKPNDKFIEKVALKSQVKKEKIKTIFKLFETLKDQSIVEDEALIDLHHNIEYFYKNCM